MYLNLTVDNLRTIRSLLVVQMSEINKVLQSFQKHKVHSKALSTYLERLENIHFFINSEINRKHIKEV